MKRSINNLDREILDHIVEIVLSHKRVEKIVIFGSRATEEFNRTSDIDIAIFGRNWSGKDINLVKDELEEGVGTPLKFDLLNFYDITKEGLKESILRDGRVIYESKED